MKLRALAIVTALAAPALAAADDQTPNQPGKPTDPSSPTDKTADPSSPSDKPTDTDKSNPPTKDAKLGDGDVKIIAHLHHVNQMEIDLGKAAQKSGTASVKSYAETLVKDHQSSDQDLTSFARSHKLGTIPADKPQADTDKQDQKAMMTQVAHLKTLKGAAFDREFLDMMATGHDKELAKIDVATGAASDPDLQTMLKSIKPVLQRHADQARDLQKNPQASATQPSDTVPSSR